MAIGYGIHTSSSSSDSWEALSFSSSGVPFKYNYDSSYNRACRSPFNSGDYISLWSTSEWINGGMGYYTSGHCYSTSSSSSSTGSYITAFNYYTISLNNSLYGDVIWSQEPRYGRFVRNGNTIKAISGQTGRISAYPSPGYFFKNWSNGSTEQETTITFSSDQNISAVFKKKPSLTVTAGYGGNIVVDPSGSAVNPNNSYTAQVSVSEGYRFTGWWSNGQRVSTDNPVQIPVYEDDVAYEARFTSIYHEVRVSVSSSCDPGSASVKMYVDGVEKESGSLIPEGTYVRILCNPKIDYNFANWIVDGSNVYNSDYTFCISQDHSTVIDCLAVTSEKNQYNILVTKSDNSRGTVSLEDAEKSWSEGEGTNQIQVIGHSGVRYTVTANVVSSTSETGRELNKFSGFTKNGSALLYTEIISGYKYQAQFTNGSNLTSEYLNNVDIVAAFAPKTLYHAETEVNYEDRGSALIIPSPDVTSPTSKWLEGTITVVATPSTGMKVTSFNVQDLDHGGHGFVINDPAKDADNKFRCSFTLNFNAKIIVNFQAIPCTVSVGIHNASIGKGTATVASTAQGGGTDNMKYGDVAIYTATPYTTPDPGYQFSGWYYENGTTVPDSTIITEGSSHTYHYYDAEYRLSLTGDTTLYARFKARVTIGLSATASASGSVMLDDQTTSSTAISKWVELGSTCNISATSITGYFGAWYASDDSGFNNPLDISASETLTVADTISYVARFVSSEDALYVAMCNYDNDTGNADATLGNLLMQTTVQTPAEVTTCTEQQFLLATHLATAPAGAVKYYTIVGTSKVSIIASTAMGRGFFKWTRLAIHGNPGIIDPEVSLEPRESNIQTVVNRHFIYRAYWGDPKPSRIKLNYCNGNNITMGNINMEGVVVADASIESKVQTATETSATYTQNDIVKIFVDIKNGYLFDGWYYDSEYEYPLPNSTIDGVTYNNKDAEYRFVVSSPVTICAKFREDTNKLFKWEGSPSNKMIDWKSKVYVSNKPFDPGVVRVDATGYTVGVGGSLTLTIGMFSSPNSSPSSTRQISIANQDMRRIPVRRPERFLQVEVQNNNEVDAIYVGTNATGIAL